MDKTNIEYVLPEEIEKRSFAIIAAELAERGVILPAEQDMITRRVIHTSADFDYAETMTYSENAVEIAKNLIKNGADIVTDTNMALAGINKKVLASFGGEAHCYMADAEVAAMAKERRTTRAAISMELAAKREKPVIFAVGNAPTALIQIYEMMQESEYSKLQTGYSYGVTPEAYVAFRELLPKFDFDGNGTFKQEEVEAAIDSMGGGGNGIVLPGAGGGQSLTVTQQAALWQLANKSWKPAKNPYSTSVGQKVYDALNAETESGIVLPDGTSYTGGLVLPKG